MLVAASSNQTDDHQQDDKRRESELRLRDRCDWYASFCHVEVVDDGKSISRNDEPVVRYIKKSRRNSVELDGSSDFIRVLARIQGLNKL